MEAALVWLREAPLRQAMMALLLENVVIFVGVVLLGQWLVRRHERRRVALPARDLEQNEVVLALSNVLLNTVTTIVGLFLWRAGIVRFRTDVGWRAWLDVPILLLVMDLAMYGLHRLAHHPWFYGWMHALHHRYDRPRPLTLFILNPLENLAFGALWLVVISVYQASWLGMSIYLALNVLFGMIGHLGVEPLPAWWRRVPLLATITGGTFHARHHQDVNCNYGFYTLIWDRLFGTLRPDYWETFGLVPDWLSAAKEPPTRGEPGSPLV